MTSGKRESVRAQLGASFQGELQTTPALLEEYATNYGGVLRGVPEAVVRPAVHGDIPIILKAGRETKTALSIRGAGHSCEGHGICSDGLVLETLTGAARAAELVFLPEHRVEVPAGLTWHALELELNKRGRSVTVYTTPMSTTVGGTIAVGGIGPRSLHHGLQTSAVERLLLALPDGSSVWCSPNDERELFYYTLAGLGQTGCIVRVVLQTIPARALAIHTRSFPSIMELADAMEPLAGTMENPPAEFHGKISREGFQAFYAYAGMQSEGREGKSPGKICPNTPLKYHREISAWSAHFPDHARLWSDFVFNYGDFQVYMEFLGGLLEEWPLKKYLDVVWILPIRVPRFRPVFAPLPAEPEDVVFSIGLYNMIPRLDPVGIMAVRDVLRKCLDRALELRGRPYLYAWYQLDDDLKHRIYGRDYERFLEIKRELDPEHLVNPGLL